MKKSIFITSLVMVFGLTACQKFLEEDFKSGVNSASITDSEQTFETLINSSFVTLRAWYGKENGWDLTEAGTDLYTWGLDNRSRGFCTYETFTTSEEQERVGAMWRELYKALNTCNIILTNIDEVPYESDDLREQRRGEVSYLRAHYLWLISEIWGGVHFSLEPSELAVHEANRTDLSVWHDQIISDLHTALNRVEDRALGEDYGRPDKAATEAMLARVHLYYENYDSASIYAQNVINNYDFALIDDYASIFDINNIKNSEVVWAVNYSDDPEYTRTNLTDVVGDEYNGAGLIQRDGGNTGHLMYEIRYENTSWGMVRDLENGRGFQRWMPTRFFIELFDETIDERFYASFKNTWYCNSENIPTWSDDTYWIGDDELSVPANLQGQPLFSVGDTSIAFYKQPLPDDARARLQEDAIRQFDPEGGFLMFDINDMYLADGTPNDDIINRQFYFPITKKYEDPTRLEIATQFSERDAMVFRIAEMYLIVAEAEMLGGDKSVALDFMNQLRRSRAYDGMEAAMEISIDELDIDFILDERARELATEYQRFFDLKRTGKLVERVSAYNTDAAPYIQEYHKLRFIPQTQIDAMTNAVGYQNPGY
ncbi:MAG: RagB/SusD family nutrient uptake outer membrane protein [Bacteroidetes bacterium]|nr:RagB/SusD family nutrient uptake outer membrane protein [Bacteroidota bacterium]